MQCPPVAITFIVKTVTYQVWILHDGNNCQFYDFLFAKLPKTAQVKLFHRKLPAAGVKYLSQELMRCIENLLLWLVDYVVRSCVLRHAYHLNLIKTFRHRKITHHTLDLK